MSPEDITEMFADRFASHKGKRFVVPKGARVSTTNRRYPVGFFANAKARTVTIFDASAGHPDYKDHNDRVIASYPATITWVGGSDYWWHAQLEDCQALDPISVPSL